MDTRHKPISVEFEGVTYQLSGRYYVAPPSKRKDHCNLHRAVWSFFNGPIPDGYHVHHKNHNSFDNRIENLEIFTSPGIHLQHHRPDLKEKQRIAYKGKHFSLHTEFKKGMKPWNLGTKGKIKSWNKGKTGVYSQEALEKMSKSHRGKPNSSSTKFKKGMIPWNKGLFRE